MFFVGAMIMYMARMYRMYKFFGLYEICLLQKVRAKKQAQIESMTELKRSLADKESFTSSLASEDEINRLAKTPKRPKTSALETTNDFPSILEVEVEEETLDDAPIRSTKNKRSYKT